MRHTVKVSPGLTIIAILIGASLLGLIGALVAIPIAATIQPLLEELAVPARTSGRGTAYRPTAFPLWVQGAPRDALFRRPTPSWAVLWFVRR